jgi:D-ribose pyranose/furanose isomerase RbsD
MFIIDQEEIMHKMAQKKMFNKKSSFVKINQNIFGTNLKKDIQSLNRKKIKKLLFNSEKQIKSGNQSPLFNIALTEDFKNNKIKNNSNI